MCVSPFICVNVRPVMKHSCFRNCNSSIWTITFPVQAVLEEHLTSQIPGAIKKKESALRFFFITINIDNVIKHLKPDPSLGKAYTIYPKILWLCLLVIHMPNKLTRSSLNNCIFTENNSHSRHTGERFLPPGITSCSGPSHIQSTS